MSINTPTGLGPLPADPPHPGTSPGHTRVRRLHQNGRTSRAIIARQASATVHDRACGRDWLTDAAAAAPTITADAVPPGRLDAGGTRLRLRALHVMGHNCVRIARALDVGKTAIKELVRGDARTVSPKLRDAIADLYDAWWDKRAPARTRSERGTTTAARKRAIAGNWCAGAALDDDLLDVPGYQPQQGWKPATGTGIASDIRPPYRRRENRHDPR
jgi:hypothetical protein